MTRVVRLETSVCLPYCKADEQPNQKPKKKLLLTQKKRTRRQCCGYCEKCITVGLCLARLGSIGFSKWKTVSEKPDAKSWDRFEEYESQSTLRQASTREMKGKKQVEALHQRSPHALKFEDRSHAETARQQRCAQNKAWNLPKNRCELKEKDKATFFSPAEKWVLLVASTKEPEEREFVVDSKASVHMVSEKDLNSAELA